MRNNLFFYFSLIALAAIGVWGVAHIELSPNTIEQSNSALTNTESQEQLEDTPEFTKKNTIDHKTTAENYFLVIVDLLRKGNVRQASFAINDHHSSLSSTELEQLKTEFIKLASESTQEQRKQTLLLASKVFDDIEVWELLSLVAEKTHDWELAYEAQLKTSQLESDSVKLDALLNRMVRSSGHIRAIHEQNGDKLSVKVLYQELVDLHPYFTRFQLELAHSHVRLNDLDAAKALYETLRYDPEFGDIAQNALTKITESKTSGNTDIEAKKTPEALRRSDIVVSLIPAGSSFLVDTNIDRTRSRLLLDTGASITSLSRHLIERLNLRPTGQSIRLSTANGITQSRLFKVDSLSLGRLTLKNMVVAEIDLSQRNSFEGLLGTDALNQFKSKYSYIIDNQKNALIFRAR